MRWPILIAIALSIGITIAVVKIDPPVAEIICTPFAGQKSMVDLTQLKSTGTLCPSESVFKNMTDGQKTAHAGAGCKID
jgi:hypothetical protein